MALPVIVYCVALFALPAATVVKTSLTPGTAITGGGVTGAHYKEFFSGSLDVKALVNTLLIALLTVVVTATIGLVYAYLLSTKPGLRQTQIAMLLAPLLVNGVVRLFGLQLGFNALNQFLQNIGVIHSPLPLQYSYPAIVVALVMFLFPYMAMSIYASLVRMDTSLVEAARTLGAGRLSVIAHIVVPIAMPGLVAGSILTFATAAGSYIVPAMMGGGRINTLPVMIYSSVSQAGQWGTGSALSLILAAVLIIPILRFSTLGARNTASVR